MSAVAERASLRRGTAVGSGRPYLLKRVGGVPAHIAVEPAEGLGEEGNGDRPDLPNRLGGANERMRPYQGYLHSVSRVALNPLAYRFNGRGAQLPGGCCI